jgi:hypothetical protein
MCSALPGKPLTAGGRRLLFDNIVSRASVSTHPASGYYQRLLGFCLQGLRITADLHPIDGLRLLPARVALKGLATSMGRVYLRITPASSWCRRPGSRKLRGSIFEEARFRGESGLFDSEYGGSRSVLQVPDPVVAGVSNQIEFDCGAHVCVRVILQYNF